MTQAEQRLDAAAATRALANTNCHKAYKVSNRAQRAERDALAAWEVANKEWIAAIVALEQGIRMLFHVKRNPDAVWRMAPPWLDILAIAPSGEVYARKPGGFIIFEPDGIAIAVNLQDARAKGCEFYMAEKD